MGAYENTSLQAVNTGTSAIFVFLRGGTPNTTGAFDDSIPNDRHGTLTQEHVAAFGRNDPTECRMAGSFGKVATGAAKRR